MNNCYTHINISIPPLLGNPLDYTKDWPKGRQDKLCDKNLLNPDLLVFFQNKNIRIQEKFILWWWNTKVSRLPHTDGDWFSKEETVKKRPCGINWNFTPNTWVEFYSTEGATPVVDFRNDYDFSTSWENISVVIDKWNSAGPVIFNPQIPHMIKSGPGVFKRLSMTLRFYETYESLVEKFSEDAVV